MEPEVPSFSNSNNTIFEGLMEVLNKPPLVKYRKQYCYRQNKTKNKTNKQAVVLCSIISSDEHEACLLCAMLYGPVKV